MEIIKGSRLILDFAQVHEASLKDLLKNLKSQIQKSKSEKSQRRTGEKPTEGSEGPTSSGSMYETRVPEGIID